MEILYEDNHLIVVNKRPGDIVQGDRTGDTPLSEQVKNYLKEKYQKPGNVFLGVVHRLDRPVSGIVLFAKTSKALVRMNALFAQKEEHLKKLYWAITERSLTPQSGRLTNWLKKNEQQNKSYVVSSTSSGAKKAILEYKTIFQGDKYTLLEINLLTGRHHQIRVQLSAAGAVIKGDLKYGAKRSLSNGGIALHARYLAFQHPVTHQLIEITAPLSSAADNLMSIFEQ